MSKAVDDYQSHYVAFQQYLQQVLEELNENPVWNFQPVMDSLKQMYQTQILNLDLQALPLETAHTLQAVQVEIDKQLRLLGMDAQFLQAAKQPATIEQRQKQILDRWQTLLRYCALVLKETET